MRISLSSGFTSIGRTFTVAGLYLMFHPFYLSAQDTTVPPTQNIPPDANSSQRVNVPPIAPLDPTQSMATQQDQDSDTTPCPTEGTPLSDGNGDLQYPNGNTDSRYANGSTDSQYANGNTESQYPTGSTDLQYSNGNTDPRCSGRRVDPRYSNGRLVNPNSNQSNRNTREDTLENPRTMVRPPAPTEFQLLTRSTTGSLLPIFGASLFRNVPTTFAPVENIPVASDYTLGPGDEVRLQVWGQVNQTSRYTIDRNGSIFITNVGSIQLAGLPYAKLDDFLHSQFARVYRNFDLTATLGRLRSIPIFVVGNVQRPGSFSVSSLSTLVNALFASGGPLPTGSLRHIQLKRNGVVVQEFDLYDLLLRGDKSKDSVLRPGDVVLVPPAGPMVALTTGVTTPAIYELKGTTTVDEAIEMAGGLLATVSNQTARIERIKDHTLRSFVSVDLVKDAKTPLSDGDILSFTKIRDEFENAVTLRGNVATPRRYVWHPGMKLRDLIPDKDALITRDYWTRRNRLALVTPSDYGKINPGGLAIAPPVASGTATANSTVASTSTALSGQFPARNDVILSGADIDWNYAEIERLSSQDLTTSLIPFNPGKLLLSGDETQNLELEPGDIVTIFSKADIQVPQTQKTRFVRLEGEFASAGIYSVLPGETLRSLVVRAGGLTKDAYLFGSQFTRQSTQRIQQERLNEYIENLDARISQLSLSSSSRAINSQDSAVAAASAAEARAVIQHLRQQRASGRIVLEVSPDSSQVDQLPDLQLEDGDRFVIPHVPAVVNVVGSVYDQNSFIFNSSLRLGDYLRMAGGPNRDSDRHRDFVIRADGSVVSSQYKSGFRGTHFEGLHLYPGDSIVVPQRVDQQAFLRNLLDVSQIVGQFGLGIAAINVLK